MANLVLTKSFRCS